ncbi:hypothetical protein NL676_020170 [Syzygium grande]|nr:hypothetical protein NL676_020170 [Syzygium grande]
MLMPQTDALSDGEHGRDPVLPAPAALAEKPLIRTAHLSSGTPRAIKGFAWSRQQEETPPASHGQRRRFETDGDYKTNKSNFWCC